MAETGGVRVSVDVRPRLLRDAIVRVLVEHDVDVVPAPPAQHEAGLDLVVMAVPEASAPGRNVVVHVVTTNDTSQVAVPGATGTSQVVDDLDALVDAVRRFARLSNG